MSNSMIKTNRTLFKRLEKLLPHDEVLTSEVIIGNKSIRHIYTEEKDENVLKNSEIKLSVVTSDKSLVCLLDFEKESYLIIVPTGQSNYLDFLNGIHKTSIDESLINIENSGLLTLLWSDSTYPFRSSDLSNLGYVLLENIFCREGKEEGEFLYSELEKYFITPLIWKLDIEKHSLINKNLLLAFFSGFVLSQPRSEFKLNFKDETLINFKALIENSPMDLIGSNIYKSMFSTDWDHCFLELYRCVEFLYPLPYLHDFANVIMDSSLLPKMYLNAEDKLNWRPKEADALFRLIKELGEEKESVSKLRDCFEIIEGANFDVKSTSSSIVSNRIYKLRNSIAHFRVSSNYKISKEIHFNDLISNLLLLITDLYGMHLASVSKIKEAIIN